MSVVQAVCFLSCRNSLREWVFMSHPRHVLCSASCPSPASFLKEIGSSSFRGSDGCSGRKSVWMTDRAALFAQSIKCLTSTVMVMMSLIDWSTMPLWLWFPLLRGMPLQDGLMTAIYCPVVVMIGVVSLGHMCPRINPGVDYLLGLLTLH